MPLVLVKILDRGLKLDEKGQKVKLKIQPMSKKGTEFRLVSLPNKRKP